MTSTSLPALSRRLFLLSLASTAAALALPLQGMASVPTPAAAAFGGDSLLVAADGLLRSEDAGQSWQKLDVPGPVTALATHPEHPNRVLAGFSEGITLSENGGKTWSARSEGLPDAKVLGVTIAARAPDTFYASLRGDGLWMSEDAGMSWSLVMDRPWIEEEERDPLTLASVDLESGMGGIWIYAGTESGLTRVPDCFCRWQDVQPVNAMDALVAGSAPPSEAPLPEGEPVHSLASAPSDPDTLYAALPSGIWFSPDGGVVWTQRASGSASAVAVHPQDEASILAVVDGDLRFSRDGGATWTTLKIP